MALATREGQDQSYSSESGGIAPAPAQSVDRRGEVAPSATVTSRVAARLLRSGRPLRTVRARLSLFYGTLFLVSGGALLAVTYLLVVVSTPAVPLPEAQIFAKGHFPVSFHKAIAIQRALELHVLLVRSGLALVIMAAVSICLGWVMAGRVLRPLRVITATARQISEENLDERLSLRGPKDEMRLLGDTIDGLLDRLQCAFEAQRAFVTNASHELRTPLAGIRVSIDVAARRAPPTSPDTLALAEKVRADLDQADRLLENFLVLARVQRGAITDLEQVSLAKLASDALDDRSGTIAERNLRVTVALADAQVVGNGLLLARLVANVIDNAALHSELDGCIRVTTKTGDDTAYLVVESDGSLLEQARVNQLVQPFKRLGAERTGSEEGLGLGLAIVSAIATAHRGYVQLSARPEGGLRVTVSLPVRLHHGGDLR